MKQFFTFFFLMNLPFQGLTQETLEIYEIQGAGMSSPVLGDTVITENNIVTALAGNGFFIQTPDDRTDNNPETSDGLFVFLNAEPSVSVGDMVTVEGRVFEYHELTEIDRPITVTVISSDNPLPAAVEFDATMPSPNQPQPENEFERFEGMRVEVINGVTTAATDASGNVSIVAKAERAFREPGIAYPGLPGLPVWDGNPEIFQLDPDGLLLPDQILQAGAKITYAVGPLTQYDNNYQLWPVRLIVDSNIAPRPVRQREAGEFIIATQNIEVFVDDVDNPIKDEFVISPEAFAIRLNKLSLQIRESLRAPDILCVQEIEGPELLQKLANKIHADDPGIEYTTYLDERGPFFPASRASLGLLVRNTVQVDSVAPLGLGATFEFEGETQATHFRPPLVLYGSLKTEPPFPITVMVVHIKSLGGIEGPSENLVRTRRFEESLAIAQYIQQMQSDNPDIHLVVAGDFNAFEFTDGYVDVMGQITGSPDPLGAQFPPTDIVNPDFINQVLSVPHDDRYSFEFQSSVQVLDHVVTSQALQPYVSGIAYSRGNADVPEIDIYVDDETTPMRTSDHDGLALFLKPVDTNVGVAQKEEFLPSEFYLHQNYPNPFNPATVIQYALPEAARVTLTVFDIRGREVRRLITDEFKSAGSYTVSWNGHDDSGSLLSSGMYFYRIQFIAENGTNHSFARKMVFLK